MKKKASHNGSSKPHKGNAARAKSRADATAGLTELFHNQLKDIYWAEKALAKAIPKMVKKATSQELRTALTDHLSETESQASRLEEVFGIIGKKPQAKKCDAMDGLIKEAEEIMKDNDEGMVRDAGIISAAQKIEHYEIATYGTLCAFSKTLGLDDAGDILKDILDEEKAADEKLTQIAESSVNIEAADEDESMEHESDDDDGDMLVKRRRR